MKAKPEHGLLGSVLVGMDPFFLSGLHDHVLMMNDKAWSQSPASSLGTVFSETHSFRDASAGCSGSY